jgi:hypothetical protein
MDYLLTARNIIKLLPSKYPKFLTIAGGTVPLFHIHTQCLVEGGKYGKPPPMDCERAFRLAEGEAEFDAFYEAWLGDNASWYRGFNCSHFAYPDIRKGMLFSEGEADLPTFTMGNSEKTRWLPGVWNRSEAEDISISGTDQYTSALSLSEKTFPIPISITVRVSLGINKPVPIAWMNSGEQLLRGPLGEGVFDVCTMYWMRNRNPNKTPWNLGCNYLPPARPYNPTEKKIQEWWDTCEEWRNSITKVGGLVFVLRLRGG